MSTWTLLLCMILSVALCSAQNTVTAVNGTCPSTTTARAASLSTLTSQVDTILQGTVIPSLKSRDYPPCKCQDSGNWTRIAYLNMSDPSHQCPSSWSLVTTPVRGCGRPSSSTACESATFTSNSQPYQHVCGRLHAYQKGSPNGFQQFSRPHDLNGPYLDGISITHGTAGSRQHIWSFVAALYAAYPSYRALFNCACTNVNFPWPYQVPAFIGNNYYCATGNPGPNELSDTRYYPDVMFDGEGCVTTDACCTFNDPPWFCTTLSQPTTDDLEVRICADQSPSNEEALLSLLEIYIM